RQIYRFLKRIMIGDTFSGNIECSSMIRRCTNFRESRSIVDASAKCQCLEWHQPLIVIRRNDCIVFCPSIAAEETICRERPKNQRPFVEHLTNDRFKDFFVFLAYYSAITCMRIESEHRNFRP